eukprot:5062810-Pyramimonas_sp.AAC.1
MEDQRRAYTSFLNHPFKRWVFGGDRLGAPKRTGQTSNNSEIPTTRHQRPEKSGENLIIVASLA